MISFKIYVAEALDNPYPLKWKTNNPDEANAAARTKNAELLIYFSNLASTGDAPIVDISFLTKKPGAPGYGTMQATGEGDEFRVFATVKKAIEDWWKMRKKLYKKEIDEIKFVASKGDDKDARRRDVLYKRLGKELAKKTGYNLIIQQASHGVIFRLITDKEKNKRDRFSRLAEPIGRR